MKKVLSVALVLSMVFSLAGCSKSSSGNDSSDVPGKLSNCSLGFGYRNLEKRTIKALEYSCGAKEMPEKTKKELLKNNMEEPGNYFKKSYYVTVTADDIEGMDLDEDDDSEIPSDKIKNMFMFQKSEGKSTMQITMMELDGEEYSEKAYKSMKKSMENLKKKFGGDDFTIEENDGKMMYYYDMYNISAYGYSFANGKQYIALSFSGNLKDDLYDEFCEFLSEMKYTDLEEFMENDSDEEEEDEEEDDEAEDEED